MKHTLFRITLGAIFLFMFSGIAYAIAPPTLDPVKSPFDGTKQVINGTTMPGARVTVTGGPYQIPPVTVGNDGRFSVTLSLSQNNTNIFQVWVADDEDVSDQITITIVESEAQAAAHAASTGQDLSAPEAPVVEAVNQTVDTYYYDIKGDAEPGTRIFVTGSDEVEAVVATSGRFVAKVRLEQNKKNTFYLEAKDSDDNVSPKTLFTITERGETNEEEDVRVVIDETTGEQSFVVEVADPFSDIAGHPKQNYVEALRLQGVLHGYPDGTVRPDSFVNRAELLKMAMLSFQLNVLNEASNSPFIDVPRFTWFARFVETGKEEGVISGYPDGSFRPEQTVNRAEALKIILESAGTPYNEFPEAEYLFSDVRENAVNNWYYPYVYFLRQNHIISAHSDGTIRLNDSMTRGDLAEIIVKLQYFIENK